MKIEAVKELCSRISMSLLGQNFNIRIEHDNEFENGRIFIQITYSSPCSKTNEIREWHGRK